VVLVDPTSPDQMARMKEERHANYAILQSMITLNALHTVSAEVRGMSATSQQWHAAGGFPQRPMILLSANRATAIDGAEFPAFIQRLQSSVVGAWPGAEQRFIDSRHYIQRERPEAVITAIREVFDRALSGAGPASTQ
jgi:hypothetical protein